LLSSVASEDNPVGLDHLLEILCHLEALFELSLRVKADSLSALGLCFSYDSLLAELSCLKSDSGSDLECLLLGISLCHLCDLICLCLTKDSLCLLLCSLLSLGLNCLCLNDFD
jgi:hypothetical protein